MSLICEICECEYDLEKHLPKKPLCNHTICLACFIEIERAYGIFTCPLCNTVDSRDAKDVENDRNHLIYSDMKCLICDDNYDLEKHLPKKPLCNHTICLACVIQIQMNNGYFTCPICCESDFRDANEVDNNENLLIYLQRTSIQSPSYTLKSAVSINLKSFEA